MRHPLQKPSCNSAHICSWCARTNQWAGYGNLRFHTYGSRCLCRLHSTEGGSCVHTHTVQHLHPEPYPLDTFNYPAKTVNASFATTSKVFFYWSLCVIMTYTWTGSKPSGRCLIPGWKAVLNETGLPWPPQSTRKGASSRPFPSQGQGQGQRTAPCPQAAHCSGQSSGGPNPQPPRLGREQEQDEWNFNRGLPCDTKRIQLSPPRHSTLCV